MFKNRTAKVSQFPAYCWQCWGVAPVISFAVPFSLMIFKLLVARDAGTAFFASCLFVSFSTLLWLQSSSYSSEHPKGRCSCVGLGCIHGKQPPLTQTAKQSYIAGCDHCLALVSVSWWIPLMTLNGISGAPLLSALLSLTAVPMTMTFKTVMYAAASWWTLLLTSTQHLSGNEHASNCKFKNNQGTSRYKQGYMQIQSGYMHILSRIAQNAWYKRDLCRF